MTRPNAPPAADDAAQARRVLRHKPRDAAALEILGLAAYRLGRLAAARHYLEASISADPARPAPREALALVTRDIAAQGGSEPPRPRVLTAALRVLAHKLAVLRRRAH